MQNEELLLIAYSIVIAVALVGALVFVFVIFQRRKNKLLIQQMEARQRFQQEMADARLEIQEQTLRNIAWELHDNIGQLLAVTNMQLSLLEQNAQEELREKLRESKEMVGNAISEVRSLSKTLNSEVVNNNGLQASLETELDRFNRMKFLDAKLSVSGTPFELDDNTQVLIFRILQEFFSNVIKHAGASSLRVELNWLDDGLELQAVENGKGFDTSMQRRSSGLQNMESRAKLLDAQLNIDSTPGKGTTLHLAYRPKP